jgi:hypothetical protein
MYGGSNEKPHPDAGAGTVVHFTPTPRAPEPVAQVDPSIHAADDRPPVIVGPPEPSIPAPTPDPEPPAQPAALHEGKARHKRKRKS